MSPQGRPKGEFLSATREGLLVSAGMHAPGLQSARTMFAWRAPFAAVPRASRLQDVTAGAVTAFAAQAFTAQLRLDGTCHRPIALGNVYG